eukprot:3679693-Rhodomonas_salina.1
MFQTHRPRHLCRQAPLSESRLRVVLADDGTFNESQSLSGQRTRLRQQQDRREGNYCRRTATPATAPCGVTTPYPRRRDPPWSRLASDSELNLRRCYE